MVASVFGPNRDLLLSTSIASTPRVLRLSGSPCSKIVFGALYRPGSLGPSDAAHLQYLDNITNDARSHGDHIALAGDFNVHNES